MSKPRSLLYFLIILICVIGLTIGIISSRKIDPEPPTETIQRGEIQNRISDINLPLVYQVSDLEELVNEKIRGVIYRDESFDNNKKDRIKLNVRRSGKIFVAVMGHDVFYNVPLSVKTEFKKGILPVIKTDFTLRVKFLSRFTLNKDWMLKSQTSFLALEWIKKPKINIAVASIGITGIVEKAIRSRMGHLTAIIDRYVPERLDVKKEITKVWTGIQRPILINSREKKVWLKIDPQSISSGRFTGKNRTIYLKLRIYSYCFVSEEFGQLVIFSKLWFTYNKAKQGDINEQEENSILGLHC